MRNRTTQQMLEAPIGAIYVWVHPPLYYAVDLAKFHHREDLQIVTPGWLESPANIRGRHFSGIVLDHAAYLTAEQWQGWQEVMQRIKQ